MGRRPAAVRALRVAVPRVRADVPAGDAHGAPRRDDGIPIAVDRALGYNDVVDAWNYYLQHDNNGRGVVLVGHSQGSGVLTQLIRNEIDGKPVQSRLVSAMLLGTSLPVPRGKDVGGAFKYIPLCRSASQTGCVIAYASFRSTIPPPDKHSLRARAGGEHGGGVRESGGARRRQR